MINEEETCSTGPRVDAGLSYNISRHRERQPRVEASLPAPVPGQTVKRCLARSCSTVDLQLEPEAVKRTGPERSRSRSAESLENMLKVACTGTVAHC